LSPSAPIRPHGSFQARTQLEFLPQKFDVNVLCAFGDVHVPSDQLVAPAVDLALEDAVILLGNPASVKREGRLFSRSEFTSNWVRPFSDGYPLR
jgi:hypothetical protein